MATSGRVSGCPAWNASNSTWPSSRSPAGLTTTANFAGIRPATLASAPATGPNVTTAAASQSASWNARSSGGSSGFVGLKVAPAMSVP